MAKTLLLVLLTFALVVASIAEHRAESAAADDGGGDLAQRQETMAEVHRVFSNPASDADSETTRRLAQFLQREIGPFGPIVEAIQAMPENSAADVHAKDEATDAVLEELSRHFRLLLPQVYGKTDEL